MDKKRWLCALVAAGVLTPCLPAEEPPPSEPPTVVVPYNPALPVDGQTPSRLYLDYETFQRLWKAAKDRRAATEAEARASLGERAATVSSALHSARVDGARLVAEARFAVLTRGPDWVEVPFAWAGASPRTITVDGAPAALRNGQLIVEKPGLHSVVVEYEVPLPAGWIEASWNVPAAAATSVALRLAADDPARLELNGMPVVVSEADGARMFTAAVGHTDRLTVRRTLVSSRAGGTEGDPPLVTTRERLFVTPALERLETRATFVFAGQERQSFSLRLDPTVTPVRFDIPGLKTWSLAGPEDGLNRLEFQLVAPVHESFTIDLVAERAVPAVPATLTFPGFAAAAGRLEREVTLMAGDAIDLRPQPDPHWRQIAGTPLSEEEAGGFATVATFAGTNLSPALAYNLRSRTVERLATTSYVFQLSPGKFELIAGLELRPAPAEDLLEATVRLPDGLTVQGVAGERVADWWREGDTLRLRFGGATPGTTAVTLNLTRSLEAGRTDVPFTPLSIDGFTRIDGSGLLVAPLSLDAVLDFDQPAAVVRETSPDAANRGFTVLPPFEIKRGFTFDRAGWTATARLAPVAPQFEADWVLDAEVHDGFVALNAHVHVRVRQGALTAVQFTLPAILPVMEVQGEDVREVVSSVDGALRRYTATLQRETNSPLALTLNGELPYAGQVVLPDLDLPGATRLERFVILENESEGRLEVRKSGLNESSREAVSFLPEELAASQRPAQYFTAQPGWTATVVVEPLATTTAQAAIVLEADLTTSLLRTGEEWVRAVYRLHNRSLQFLPVALPKAAQLVSVMVAGRPSRADVGEVNGQPVTLVPLIQTRPGDRSVEVSLVYRLAGPPPVRGVFERSLDDPDLPGLSVQQTLWSVQLPDGFTLRHARGPMTRVDATSWDAEKWLGRLAESASLLSLSSAGGYDTRTKEQALKNSEQLLSELEAAEGRTKRSKRSTDAGDAYAQVAEELKRQQVQLASNLAQVRQEKSAAAPTDPAPQGGSATYKKSFVFNRDSVAAEAIPAQSLQADASQLAVNDNVFWSAQTAVKPGGATRVDQTPELQRRRSQLGKLADRAAGASAQTPALVSGPQGAGAQATGGSFQSGDFSGVQSFVVPPAAEAVAAGQDQRQFFANSRVNELAPQNQAAPSPPASTPAAQAETPAAPPASIPARTKEAPAADGTSAPTAALESHAAVAEVFPAQANAVFFKKVKDRAAIQLTAAEPRFDTRRWTHLGLLAGIALLILLIDRGRVVHQRRLAAARAAA